MYPSQASPPNPASHLTWLHVCFGFVFVIFNSAISQMLQLRIGTSLMIAALRCMVQLTIVAIILQHLLSVKKLWAVAGIALVLSTLTAFEIVVIKAKRRCRHMFPAVLSAILVSTISVSILGIRFAMNVVQFWTPEQYLPIIGMLCGNTITAVSVSLGHILKELDEFCNSTETLSDTSRLRGYRPLIVEALHLGLMPTINQMSVMGIISIPGMMTRAILDGSDVKQAAQMQMIIMFMIAASNALSCIIATHLVLRTCIDSEHRIRSDCIDTRPHALHRASSDAVQAVISTVGRAWAFAVSGLDHMLGEVGVGRSGDTNALSERTRLIN